MSTTPKFAVVLIFVFVLFAVFKAMSKKKAALIIEDEILMFKSPTIYSKPVAILKEGRLVKVVSCKDVWCKIKTGKFKGWLKKEYLWGLL